MSPNDSMLARQLQALEGFKELHEAAAVTIAQGDVVARTAMTTGTNVIIARFDMTAAEDCS